MATRRKFAIIYTYDEKWIGGAYFIRNLVAALNTLPDEDKPFLVIITEKEANYHSLIEDTGYLYSEWRYHRKRLGILARFANAIALRVFGKKLIQDCQIGLYDDVELLFPATLDDPILSACNGKIFWIPDFQEHYLPEFFSPKAIELRKRRQSCIVAKGTDIVFSSDSARGDFNEIYPNNTLRQYVLPFAVSHNRLAKEVGAKAKYCLPERYFICCNQFWAHKNHKLVLEALRHLAGSGHKAHVVFTGKEQDYRNPEYFDEIKSMVARYGLESGTSFLGFIPREDQLDLMRKSIAVIQPSLFEGWNTSIEDAKSLNLWVLASDLAVHREQLRGYPGKLLFDPRDPNSLAECMISIQSDEIPIASYDYNSEVMRYGRAFLEIANNITPR